MYLVRNKNIYFVHQGLRKSFPYWHKIQNIILHPEVKYSFSLEISFISTHHKKIYNRLIERNYLCEICLFDLPFKRLLKKMFIHKNPNASFIQQYKRWKQKFGIDNWANFLIPLQNAPHPRANYFAIPN